MTPRGRGRVLDPARDLYVSRLIGRADGANRAADWGKAEKLYARVLAIRPDLPAILVQYGHALKEQGFPHRAAAAYRKAAAQAGRTIDAWVQLGHVLKLLGRQRDAAAAFAAALEIDPLAPGLREERDHAAMASRFDPPPLQQALGALLEAHDLAPGVLTLIDESFYRAGDSTLQGADLWRLIDHFGRVGVERLLPLSAHAAFDPAFYRRVHPGTQRLTPARAYRHWLAIGAWSGWVPNKIAWLDTQLAPEVRRLDEEPRRFAEAAIAIETKAPSDEPLFAWLGWDQRPALPRVSDRDERMVHGLIAAGLERTGFAADAERLRAVLLRRFPSSEPAGADGAPAAVGREGAGREQWTAAAYADAAAAQERAGDWLKALAILAKGVRALPAEPNLRQTLDETADRAIHAAWARAERDTAAGTGIDEARADLTTTLRAVVAAFPTQPPLPARPIAAVAILGNADLPQCRFYRIEQKLDHLAAAGYAATFFDEQTDVPRFLAEMIRFEAVIFYRVPAHRHIIDAILAARALGLVTLYEIDDLLFDGEHYPAPLETYGGEFSPADHRGLALAVPMYAEAMALCDYALASTETLAAAMRPHVRRRKAFVHPNAFGHLHAAFAALTRPLRSAGPVTVVYGSHTKAHKADVQALVEPALAELVARHGDAVQIVLVGFVPMTPLLEALGDQVTMLDPMPLAAYWALLQTADVVVAPLFRSPATDAKSEIKWLEAAMLGLPTVASRTATAEQVIEDGVTGLLCDTTQDWTAALDRLVADPALRRAIGTRAKTEALRRYAPERAAANLRRILSSLSPPPARRRPRIAIVNVFYPPQNFGGATRVVRDNVRDLRARHDGAFDIEVFATLAVAGPPYRVRTAAIEGVRVTTVTAPGEGDEGEMRAEDAKMESAFAAFLDAARPDLVHFHCVQRLTASVVEAARRRGVPYLITVHDAWWISSHQFLLNDESTPEPYDYGDPTRTLARYGRAAFDRLLTLAPSLLGARAVLAVSDAFAALHAASQVPNVVSLPNGLSPLPPVARRPNPGGPIRLGYLGGRYERKGWPLIEQALRALENAPFTLLVVDHAMAPAETQQERWGGIRVEFRGKADPAAVGELYAGIDVLLAPSVWPESFGLVTREALRYGCWVVASDRGNVAGDVEDGVNGFVVSVTDATGLEAALARIAADPDRFRRPPPPPGRLRSSQDQADDLARLYRSILGGRTAVGERAAEGVGVAVQE